MKQFEGLQFVKFNLPLTYKSTLFISLLPCYQFSSFLMSIMHRKINTLILTCCRKNVSKDERSKLIDQVLEIASDQESQVKQFLYIYIFLLLFCSLLEGP